MHDKCLNVFYNTVFEPLNTATLFTNNNVFNNNNIVFDFVKILQKQRHIDRFVRGTLKDNRGNQTMKRDVSRVFDDNTSVVAIRIYLSIR